MKYGRNSGGIWAVSIDRKPTKEYSRWATMLSRCCNPKNQSYPRYGGRGVTVCDEWQDFQVFAQWYSETSVEGWVMDKDLLGGSMYSPSTVVWLPDQINQLVRCVGSRGYVMSHGRVQSNIVTGSEKKYLGAFIDKESAREAYMQALRCKIRDVVSQTQGLSAAATEALLSL